MLTCPRHLIAFATSSTSSIFHISTRHPFSHITPRAPTLKAPIKPHNTPPSVRFNSSRPTMSSTETPKDTTKPSALDHITPEQCSLIERLYDIGALKFGTFKLKSGLSSPVYIDLRLTVSHPELLRDISTALSEKVKDVPHDLLCGVPYTAIPFATAMSLSNGKPMLMRRKEAKAHGTKRLIEGEYAEGQTVLVVEDLVTSGLSVMETVQPLRDVGLKTNHVVVVLNRQQGAANNLSSQNITLHCLFTLTEMLLVLVDKGKIETSVRDSVLSFIQESQVSTTTNASKPATETAGGDKENGKEQTTANGSGKPKPDDKENGTEKATAAAETGANGDAKEEKQTDEKKQDSVPTTVPSDPSATFAERAALAKHPVAKRLLELMESKQSNLAVAADVTSASELLELGEQVGPHIVILKTHADIVSDWTDATAAALRDLANRHDFLIFEDRKFADIGNTTYNQVSAGVHRIATWADIVNAHAVAGDGVIAGLAKAADAADQCGWRKFGIILLAQMSSKGNLASGLEGYTQKTVEMAQRHAEHVFGFISMEKIAGDGFVYLTPGVNLADTGDGLGQQYCTPEAIVADRGSDVIIVGRGVCQAEDKAAAAKKYRHAGWKAYEKRTSGIN